MAGKIGPITSPRMLYKIMLRYAGNPDVFPVKLSRRFAQEEIRQQFRIHKDVTDPREFSFCAERAISVLQVMSRAEDKRLKRKEEGAAEPGVEVTGAADKA
eukprot:Hpha_TRINITY_DN16136_c3_g2::TRINITY_DN16136_c3_g2_i1::g.3386::m.3386